MGDRAEKGAPLNWSGGLLKNATVKSILATASVIISAIVGEWAPSMTALVVLMAADFVSAWIRATEQRKLSSTVAGWGTAKKFAMVGVMVILGAQADIFLETTIWRNAVVLFYCASECLSIFENAVAIGLPVPDKLREVLQQLNEKKYVPADDASPDGDA